MDEAREAGGERVYGEYAQGDERAYGDDAGSDSDDDMADVVVQEGEIYAAPGVCHETVRDMLIAGGSRHLAEEVYGVPDTRRLREMVDRQ